MNFLEIINNLFKVIKIRHQANILKYLKKIKLVSIIDISNHKGNISRKFINDENKKNFFLVEPQLKFFKYLFKIQKTFLDYLKVMI